MVNQILPVLSHMFTFPGILYLILGAVLGMIFGILPGLGGPQVVALLIPLSISLDNSSAVMLLVGAAGAIAISGSLTAILLNTPGTGESAAVTIDGFALTKQGKAGYAVGAAVSSGLFGAIFGALILTLILPLGRYVILALSYQENFMMAVMGLSLIAVISKGSLWKGIISGAIGMLIATMGYDPVTGSTRFAFGMTYLEGGIKLVPAVIGLFAISGAFEIFTKRTAIAEVSTSGKLVGVWDGIKSPFKHYGTFLRGATIGTIIGIIPGVGGAVSNFVAYGQEVSTQKKSPQFGKGDIRGVIAAESSNNAKDGGSFVPTLLFGIPGSATTAVLIGALILHGVEPGPDLLQTHGDIAMLLIYSLVASNIIVGILALAFSKYLAKLTFIKGTMIGSVIFVLGLVGAYISNYYIQDVIVALVFGCLGFVMDRFGYSKVAVVLSLVLGTLMQKSFFQSLQADGWTSFFTRPISLVLLCITVAFIIFPLFKKGKKSKPGEDSHEKSKLG